MTKEGRNPISEAVRPDEADRADDARQAARSVLGFRVCFVIRHSSFVIWRMPVFRYQAIDRRGRNLSGIMPALDESNLEQRLKRIGLWLTTAILERPGN